MGNAARLQFVAPSIFISDANLLNNLCKCKNLSRFNVM